MENVDYIVSENDSSDDETNNFISNSNNLQNDKINKVINKNSLNNFDNSFNINIDEITAIEVDYNLNYTIKDLKLIAEYYGIKMKRSKKEVIIQNIVDYETNDENYDIVERRKELWYYLEELKNDDYTKRFIAM